MDERFIESGLLSWNTTRTESQGTVRRAKSDDPRQQWNHTEISPWRLWANKDQGKQADSEDDSYGSIDISKIWFEHGCCPVMVSCALCRGRVAKATIVTKKRHDSMNGAKMSPLAKRIARMNALTKLVLGERRREAALQRGELTLP